MPAGVSVTRADVSRELARRRLGYGRGARMKFEADEVTFLGGVRHGLTLGSPVAVMVGNTEWPKWTTIMSADPVDTDDPEVAKEMNSGRGARLTRPRPGHADLSGMLKYGHTEARPILERSSARETAARVAAGTVARALLREVTGSEVVSHVLSIGPSDTYDGPAPTAASPVRAFTAQSDAHEKSMIEEIEKAKKSGDTLGGIVEVVVTGLPVGLGSHVAWDARLDGQLAQALMSIQAIKGVEVGDGFAEARRRGSEAHDEIFVGEDGIERHTNRAGGLEGGMTNGEPLRVRAAMKPISTVPRALATVDTDTGKKATGIHQRSDVCAVPAAGVVAESMVALVIARSLLEKFGGDSLAETKRNYAAYIAEVDSRLRWDEN